MDYAPGEGDGDALLLDGGRFLEALLINSHEELPLEEVVLEVVSCVRSAGSFQRFRCDIAA